MAVSASLRKIKGENMNYLNLINKCLTELNYKQVNAFSELVKNDHKKIMNILNILNTEICRYDKWNFLLRKSEFTLPAHTEEIQNPIEGKIASLFVNGQKYTYFEDFEKFLTKSAPLYKYSCFNEKLLFPEFEQPKTITTAYYTGKTAKDSFGNEKYLLEKETDESLIPEKFAEPLLIYGCCLRLKANPQHVKFGYWLSMYKSALANLRSENKISTDSTPFIKLFRN